MKTGVFITIQSDVEGSYREKGSRFLGYAFRVQNREEVKEKLLMLKQIHSKARHICFAYRLGSQGDDFRANDDGEPTGTAGKPILGQIDSFGLTYVLVVVVRYFGGVKLGVPGLIRAYKTTATNTLGQAILVQDVERSLLKLQFRYELTGNVMRVLDHNSLSPSSLNYHEETWLEVLVPDTLKNEITVKLIAECLGRSIEEVTEETTVSGLKISWQ